MKFGKRGDRQQKVQEFDRKKITLTKAGKTYNVYDSIQAANVDTEIYEVQKKYNTTTDQAAQFMKEHGGIKGVYMDLIPLMNNAETMGQIIDIQKKAEEMFNQLPQEIKQKYGNNLEQFLIDVSNEAKKVKEQKQEIKENDKQ